MSLLRLPSLPSLPSLPVDHGCLPSRLFLSTVSHPFLYLFRDLFSSILAIRFFVTLVMLFFVTLVMLFVTLEMLFSVMDLNVKIKSKD